MKKTFLALGVAAITLTTVPADAKQYTNITKCTKWRNGQCVASRQLTRKQARRAGYDVGYNFGPSYAYTDYGALPQPMIQRYSLHDNFRYVNRDGYVYVVNPNTYRVVRVINWP